MLNIGQIDNELDARTFGDYLYVQGIENQVDPGKNGQGHMMGIRLIST